jgi:hypothetical protein
MFLSMRLPGSKSIISFKDWSNGGTGLSIALLGQTHFLVGGHNGVRMFELLTPGDSGDRQSVWTLDLGSSTNSSLPALLPLNSTLMGARFLACTGTSLALVNTQCENGMRSQRKVELDRPFSTASRMIITPTSTIDLIRASFKDDFCGLRIYPLWTSLHPRFGEPQELLTALEGQRCHVPWEVSGPEVVILDGAFEEQSGILLLIVSTSGPRELRVFDLYSGNT